MIKHRRLLAAMVIGASAAVALPGCFPVVATGVAVGTLATVDRRTYGTQVDDQAIELKSDRRLSEGLGEKAYIYVTSFNRRVLLTGDVVDNAAKAEAERIVRGVENVTDVINEIRVGPISSLGSHANDTYITSKVKARFVEDNQFAANHVKVHTDSGTVFLMGLVTQREADAATEIARTTGSVEKVVRVFEYISDDQAQRLDKRPTENPPAGKKS